MLLGGAAFVSWSCSLDWTVPVTPDASTTDAIVSPTVDAARDGAAIDGGVDGRGDDVSVPDAVVPEVGCKSSQECPNGICTFSDFRCGSGVSGVCQPLPTKCVNDVDMYVCLCNDSWMYGRPCDLLAKGADFGTTCTEQLQNGVAQHGYVACETSSSVVVERAAAPREERYRCAKGNCQTNDCACLMQSGLCDKPVKCTPGNPTVVLCD